MRYHVPPGGRAINVQVANVQNPHSWIGKIIVPPRVVSLLKFVLSAPAEAGYLQQRFKGKSCLVSTANLPKTCVIGHIYLKLSSTYKIAQIQERFVCLFWSTPDFKSMTIDSLETLNM